MIVQQQGWFEWHVRRRLKNYRIITFPGESLSKNRDKREMLPLAKPF